MPNIWNLVFTVVLVAIGSAKCDVNLDSLFHAGVPTAAPVAPAPSKNTIEQQTTSDIPAQNGDVFDEFDREPFMPYRNSRHDEFDWALTKVRSNQATQNMNKLKKKSFSIAPTECSEQRKWKCNFVAVFGEIVAVDFGWSSRWRHKHASRASIDFAEHPINSRNPRTIRQGVRFDVGKLLHIHKTRQWWMIN